MSNVQNISEMSPKMKFFVGTIFPLIFILIGLVLFLIYLPDLLNANASKSWPTTKGKVVKSEVGSTSSSANHKGNFFPVVHYTFSVDGTSYTGDKVIFGLDKSGNATRAREVIKRYPIGEEATVYYVSDNPEECVLEPGIQWQTCLIPGFGVLFSLVGGIIVISMKQNDKFTKKMQTRINNSDGN